MPTTSIPMSIIIAPSMLAANLGRLENEVKKITLAHADWVHLDIMDGHFVPNLSFGPDFLRMIKQHTKLPCDVHLMCSHPENILEHFLDAGADNITVHSELEDRAMQLIWKIHSAGRMAGIAINPPTPFKVVEPFLSKVDLLLVMTVNPGYGGQAFIEETLTKIQQAQQWRLKHNAKFRIEVDGGINFQTVKECALCGADTFVSGTTLFRSYSCRRAIQKMRLIAETASQ